MTKQELKNIIDMLTRATAENKIKWEEVSSSKYRIVIAGCDISIAECYDISIDETYFSLSMKNSEGREFATFSFSESGTPEDYKPVRALYSTIQDKLYRISESENLIMQGLRDLLKQS